MINVEFVVVGEDINRTAQVDPSRPLDQIKADFIRAYARTKNGRNLGDPDDWEIAVGPRGRRTSAAAYQLADGDRIFLVRSSTASGSSVVL
ncbi:MAG TPA: hypothetical protein VFR67_27310 [Pilimelia sp.]|nr:hypothetical protein [Pilimelia sp.]